MKRFFCRCRDLTSDMRMGFFFVFKWVFNCLCFQLGVWFSVTVPLCFLWNGSSFSVGYTGVIIILNVRFINVSQISRFLELLDTYPLKRFHFYFNRWQRTSKKQRCFVALILEPALLCQFFRSSRHRRGRTPSCCGILAWDFECHGREGAQVSVVADLLLSVTNHCI